MSTPLEEYQRFIDELVEVSRWKYLSKSVRADEVQRDHALEKQEKEEWITSLTPERRWILGQMLEEARHSGMHDGLSYPYDSMKLEGLQISRNGVELVSDPYGSELYYDWVCRREGSRWPEEKESMP